MLFIPWQHMPSNSPWFPANLAAAACSPPASVQPACNAQHRERPAPCQRVCCSLDCCPLVQRASTASASVPGDCGLLSSCPLPCSLMRRPPLLPLGAGAGGPCERPGSAFWLGAPVCPLRPPAVQSQRVSATAPFPCISHPGWVCPLRAPAVQSQRVSTTGPLACISHPSWV